MLEPGTLAQYNMLIKCLTGRRENTPRGCFKTSLATSAFGKSEKASAYDGTSVNKTHDATTQTQVALAVHADSF